MAIDLAVREQAGAADVAAIDLTAIERVIVTGDLSKLSPDERWNYYKGVCQSVGLNPFTKPFEYITLNGKLTLYALKGATDQLRGRYGISIDKPAVDITDGLCMVTVGASDRGGRTDSDLGIVPIENLRGDARANAIMKAITKAKRRVTLSFCGLGMLDETEVETIPSARPANVETIPPHALPEGDADDEYPNLSAALEKDRARETPVLTDDEKVRATAMVGGANPQPDTGTLRADAIKRHILLGKVATDRGHAKAEVINAVDLDSLTDTQLARSVKRLEELFPDVPADLEDDAAF